METVAVPYLLSLTCLLATCGCSAFVYQTDDLIRAREPVLFEGKARIGEISNGGDRIWWVDNTQVLVTPTTLYFKGEGLSFATIDSAEVGLFSDLGDGFLVPKHGELLIIKEIRGVYPHGLALEFKQKTVTTSEGERSETGESPASQVLSIIDSQRPEVDPFGRLEGPRRVWLAAGNGKAPAGWGVEPQFLKEHHPLAKEQLEALFIGQEEELKIRYRRALLEALASSESGSSGYAFESLLGVTIDRRGWIEPYSVGEAAAELDPSLNSLLVSDVTRLLLSEVVDAEGNVGIRIELKYYLDYYDLDPPKNGEAHWYELEVTAPLQEWLEGGPEGVFECVGSTARAAALQAHRDLTR